MLESINQIEQKDVNKNIDRVVNEIKQEEGNLSAVAQDWAAWDDTYEFIKDGNAKYIDNNLHKEGFINLNLNLMAFIDMDGKYIFAKGVNLENEEFVPVYSKLKSILKRSRVIGNTDIKYKVNGIIQLPEGPMIIATYPIITSNFKGPVRGNLVIGRFLNDDLVSKMSKKTKLNISLENIGLESQKYIFIPSYPTLKSNTVIKRLNNNLISGSTVLSDIFHQPVLFLNIQMDRNIYQMGEKGINYTLYSMLFTSFIIICVLIWFFEKNILSRIVGLTKEILFIGNSSNLSLRLKPQQRRDEIFILTNEINIMLDNLEETEKKLLQSHENLERIVHQRTQELSEKNEILKVEIEERKKIQERITQLAYHDHLTGLPNRLLFNDRLNQAIFLARRMEKPLGVIFIDLDSFKLVNDTMGHDQGDELLKEIAKRLVALFRSHDTVCRIGGDEFIVAVQNIANPEDITRIANKIVGCFKKPFKLEGQDFFITSSIGIAMYPIDGEDAETLIKNADVAMYKAKENGKNKYMLCTPVMKDKVMEKMTLTNSLYRAIERNELMLYYQPQVNCETGKIIGVEALLRWKHPELGFVPPSKFIAIAEQSGLIMSIGEWVLITACKQNALWGRMGIDPIRMAINVSPMQLQNTNFANRIKEVLLETGMSPQLLEIEITESIFMNESIHIIDILSHIKEMGISISIDDFGTEYSSLSRLKEMPIDRIKIAMPFIQGIAVNEKDEAITKAIIVLARNLGLHIIAEGVETEHQLSFLSQRMCDEIQGYYYFKPLPPEEIEAILKSGAILKLDA